MNFLVPRNIVLSIALLVGIAGMIGAHELDNEDQSVRASRDIDPLTVLTNDDFERSSSVSEALLGRVTQTWVEAGQNVDEDTLVPMNIEVPGKSVIITLTQFDDADVNPGQQATLVGISDSKAEIVCANATVVSVGVSSIRVIAPAAQAAIVLGYQGKDRKIAFVVPPFTP